jgi:signal transduction histidine kinase
MEFGRSLDCVIRDDGVGFDVKEAHALAVGAGSIGLSSMRERAALAGGDFDIQSAIGHGTRIRASFPIDELVRKVWPTPLRTLEPTVH